MHGFVDNMHAFYAGWCIGMLIRQGVTVYPCVDPQGDYTPRLRIVDVDDPARSIELIIPEPPDDWQMG